MFGIMAPTQMLIMLNETEFRPRLRRGPRWESLQRSPDPYLVLRGGEGGTGVVRGGLGGLPFTIPQKLGKCIKFVITRFVFASTECPKTHLRPELHTAPKSGEFTTFPRPILGW